MQDIFKLWTFFFLHGGKFVDDFKLVLQQTTQRDRENQTSYWVLPENLLRLNLSLKDSDTTGSDPLRVVSESSGSLYEPW